MVAETRQRQARRCRVKRSSQAIGHHDLAETRCGLQGRRLGSMPAGTVRHESGQDFLQFGLEFSGKGWLSKGLFVPVAPEVAVKMRHPPDCPYGQPAQKKATGRKKRKRRKR